MSFPVSAVFGTPVREHPHQFQVMLLEERNHPVIEHVRRHERVLPVVKFGESDFGIGVDDRQYAETSGGYAYGENRIQGCPVL